jgi:hypothetical protein
MHIMPLIVSMGKHRLSNRLGFKALTGTKHHSANFRHSEAIRETSIYFKSHGVEADVAGLNQPLLRSCATDIVSGCSEMFRG